MATIEARLRRLEKELNAGQRQTVLVFGNDEPPEGTPSNAIILRAADDLRGI